MEGEEAGQVKGKHPCVENPSKALTSTVMVDGVLYRFRLRSSESTISGSAAPKSSHYVDLSAYPPGTDIHYELHWDGARAISKVPRWAHEKWLLKYQNPEGTSPSETLTDDPAALASGTKAQDSLREALGRVEQNVSTANAKVKTQEDMYKRLQEYNTILQQHNTKLQNDLEAAIDANKQAEKEKSAILGNHNTLRGYYYMLQKEFTSAKDSQDDAVKQKEAAKKEVDILRGELQQLREDRERQLLLVQELTPELHFAAYK